MKRYLFNTLLFFGVAVGVITVFQMVAQAPDLELTETKAEARTLLADRQMEINVELADFSFNPNEIRLKANQPNTLILKNTGNTQHTFTVEALKIDILLKPGETKEVVVTPSKTGTFKLYCRFHPREMVGEVIVEK
ncbi:cupredoxin domain-containing protein [Alkalihalobacillus sp. AL-G]|uniref:cupredoxin domain-containing protein n=1 Tax=Alkalihalobacillus sp. AL-G TaxID=2926399 RepID=UPI00272AC560|nr:cupredoxin domain-containing protein [Alkalihalobacillus sp. AL-G]WLD94194.1 cupredoxin domain-containing protein [Alkalihalobacillus sp. AL-G]